MKRILTLTFIFLSFSTYADYFLVPNFSVKIKTNWGEVYNSEVPTDRILIKEYISSLPKSQSEKSLELISSYAEGMQNPEVNIELQKVNTACKRAGTRLMLFISFANELTYCKNTYYSQYESEKTLFAADLSFSPQLQQSSSQCSETPLRNYQFKEENKNFWCLINRELFTNEASINFILMSLKKIH